MKRAFLTLGLSAALLGVACDSKEQCVADCDSQGSSGSTSGSESGSSSAGEPSSGGDSLQCEEHRDNISQFVQDNGECETVLDCVAVDAVCYSGAESRCGMVGLSASADLDAWDAVYGELTSECECEGADACGSVLMCNDEQQCESSFGDEAYCPSIQRDVETFLEANSACEVDEDCIQLGSNCFVNNGCYGVVVNADTNPQDWQQLDRALEDCALESSADYCNVVGDCEFPSRCSDEGQCEVVF